jgi:drug/metabolite transporter (DMT)-like permease
MGSKKRQHTIAVIGTMLTASIWGASFAAMKFTIQADLSVGVMLTLRFAIGACCLGLLLLVLRVPVRRASVLDGLRLGVLLTGVFWLQADGLRFTTTAKSGFITGLYVLFTPAASMLMGHRPRLAHALGALAAVGGLYLLVHHPTASEGGWGRGETETLLCALGCGLHIIFTGIFSRRSNAWVIAFTQVAVVAILSCLITLCLPYPNGFKGAGAALAQPGVWLTLLYLGVLATSLAFYMMSTLQAHLGATEASILYLLEPVFTALLAMSGWVPGIREHLTPLQLTGGTIILSAMVLAEVGPRLLGRRDADPIG